MDQRQKVQKVFAFPTHTGAHSEELYGIRLLKRFGEKKHPGSSTAAVCFWKQLPEGWTPEYTALQGYITVGMGHSQYDEHLPRGSGAERMENECAATLIAKSLDIQDDPVVQEMLNRLLMNDSEGAGGKFELPSLVKTISRAKGDFKTWKWAERTFDVIHEIGIDFFNSPTPDAGKWWDALVTAWLIVRHGRHFCPTITEESGPQFLESGLSPEVFEKVLRGKQLPEDGCKSIFVAKELVLDEDAAIQKLLSFTQKRCHRVEKNPLEMHNLLHGFYATNRSTQEVWEWATLALDALYARGLAFVEGAGGDYQKAKVYPITIRKKSDRKSSTLQTKLVVGTSDAHDFSAYARLKGAAIVIQENSNGDLQVSSDQKLGIDLTEAVQALRAEENSARGRFIPGDPELLGSPGTLSNCPEWYLPEHRAMIFNGTLSKKAPKTILSVSRITELVQIGMSPNRFEPTRMAYCQKGRCTSTKANPCRWFFYQLHRCRLIRFNERSAREQRHLATESGK